MPNAPLRLPLPPVQVAPPEGLVITDCDITLALRYYRLKRRWTIMELAAVSGCSRSWIQRAEVAECEITLQELLRLAQALGLAPWDLVEFPGWPLPVCPCQAEHEGAGG